jgi:hypothetical protein
METLTVETPMVEARTHLSFNSSHQLRKEHVKLTGATDPLQESKPEKRRRPTIPSSPVDGPSRRMNVKGLKKRTRRWRKRKKGTW